MYCYKKKKILVLWQFPHWQMLLRTVSWPFLNPLSVSCTYISSCPLLNQLNFLMVNCRLVSEPSVTLHLNKLVDACLETRQWIDVQKGKGAWKRAWLLNIWKEMVGFCGAAWPGCSPCCANIEMEQQCCNICSKLPAFQIFIYSSNSSEIYLKYFYFEVINIHIFPQWGMYKKRFKVI